MGNKISSIGLKYNVLDKQEVIDLNNGDVPFMRYYKGKVEWDDDKKYILVLSTGSFVLVGNNNQSDDDILDNMIKHSI